MWEAEAVVSTENGDVIGKVGVYLFQGCEWGPQVETFVLPLSELPEFLQVSFQCPLDIEIGMKITICLFLVCRLCGQELVLIKCFPCICVLY